MEKRFYNAKDLADILQICRSKAYSIIRELNIEYTQEYMKLHDDKKPLIMNGRINKDFFNKKFEV